MAEIKQNQFDEVGVNPFNAPIPGESLTSPSDMPKSWERPPQHSDAENAMEAIYMEITQENTLRRLIDMIDSDIPLDEIAQVILYKGYTEGKFNPDLMLLLIEPTLYLLIAIADYGDIRDYVLYKEEVDDPDTEISDDDVEPIMIGEDKKEKRELSKPRKEVLGESLLAKVEEELPAKVAEVKEKE